jgi:hypothetical protein
MVRFRGRPDEKARCKGKISRDARRRLSRVRSRVRSRDSGPRLCAKLETPKQKALAAALSQIEKQYGKGSIMKMDAEAIKETM